MSGPRQAIGQTSVRRTYGRWRRLKRIRLHVVGARDYSDRDSHSPEAMQAIVGYELVNEDGGACTVVQMRWKRG